MLIYPGFGSAATRPQGNGVSRRLILDQHEVRFGSMADIRRQIGDVPPESGHPICAFMSTRPSCAISRGPEPRAMGRYPARAASACVDFHPRRYPSKSKTAPQPLPIGLRGLVPLARFELTTKPL
jgi:hypothetical protein